MARKEITIQTRLGERSVDQSRVITFPKGLIGFENRRDFALLQIRDDSPFMLLQCLADSKLGLVVTDPFAFLENYEIQLGDAEQKILRIENIRQLAILVTVSIPQGRPDEAVLNLTGPICVNSKSRIGLQVPQTDPRFPSHYSLSPRSDEAAEQPAEESEK